MAGSNWGVATIPGAPSQCPLGEVKPFVNIAERLAQLVVGGLEGGQPGLGSGINPAFDPIRERAPEACEGEGDQARKEQGDDRDQRKDGVPVHLVPQVQGRRWMISIPDGDAAGMFHVGRADAWW